MKANKTLLLLKALLLSTSRRNTFKYSKDRKKRSGIILGTIGSVLLYAMIMGFCIAVCIGYGITGLIGSAPVMCALVISLISFFFTFFKTNGYLFNFREYDMLMSLPFEARTVAGCKFLYMYLQSLPWYLSISVAVMIGYGIYAKPSFLVYPVWIILSFFLPLIPMLAAAFLGFLVAKAGAGFKKKNIIQAVLSFVVIIFSFSLRFILESVFKNNEVEAVVGKVSEVIDNSAKYYPPALWFKGAVTKLGISDILLLVGLSTLLFAVVFRIVGNSYRNINSSLKSHAASKKYRMGALKARSAVKSVAYKEFRRFVGSNTYLTNVAVGQLMVAIIGIIALFVGFNKLISFITNGAPLDASLVWPAIPFIVHFLNGMMVPTVAAPSLEGKNYWIVQSVPLDKKDLYRGKMLFGMMLTVPFMLFGTLCLCISGKVPFVSTCLYLLVGFALCALSNTWGCVCGIKHMKLDWENEIEVVKQGVGVALYMFPNMIVVLGLGVLVIVLGIKMDQRIVTALVLCGVSAIAALLYARAMKLAVTRG